jgi:hypothetical protein
MNLTTDTTIKKRIEEMLEPYRGQEAPALLFLDPRIHWSLHDLRVVRVNPHFDGGGGILGVDWWLVFFPINGHLIADFGPVGYGPHLLRLRGMPTPSTDTEPLKADVYDLQGRARTYQLRLYQISPSTPDDPASPLENAVAEAWIAWRAWLRDNPGFEDGQAPDLAALTAQAMEYS